MYGLTAKMRKIDQCWFMSKKMKYFAIAKVFLKVLLPELITRKLDPANTEYQKLYCYCNRPSFEPMIACDDKNCKLVWYHYACVNITRTPPENKKWFCPDCKICLLYTSPSPRDRG